VERRHHLGERSSSEPYRTTLDAVLHGELIDFAGSLSGRIETRVPGYRAAYLFPGQE
jgi:hypothetical protein